MKSIINVVAVLGILVGGVFFFQGIGILPGELMSGKPEWAIIGGGMVVVLVGLLVFFNRRSRPA